MKFILSLLMVLLISQPAFSLSGENRKILQACNTNKELNIKIVFHKGNFTDLRYDPPRKGSWEAIGQFNSSTHGRVKLISVGKTDDEAFEDLLDCMVCYLMVEGGG